MNLNDLLSKKISRKRFLLFVAAIPVLAAFAKIGSASSVVGKQSVSEGYGGSPYGGKKTV